MTLDERPHATNLRDLLLEVRGGYVLHRPILVDVTPRAGHAVTVGLAEHTLERTLTMHVPADGEPELAAEMAGCGFVLVGANRLHASTEPPMTIGRSRRCDVRIDNESVSKVHGSIGFDDTRGYLVVDENSRNGTRVNGLPLAPGTAALVYAGAQVAFGDATFVFLDPPTLRKLARLAT